MTLVFIALAVAVLIWPVPRAGERRLLGLASAARLAGRAPGGLRLRWQRSAPPRAVITVTALGLGGLGTAWRGPAVGLAVAVAAAVGLWCAARAARRASARMSTRDLSAALRLVRGELDAGSSPAVALTAGAGVADVHRRAFEAAATALADGRDVAAAVTAAGGEPELIVIAQAWQLAVTLGIPLSGALARVDDDVQARRDQARLVASALAGPRSSAALLAGLPALGLILGLAMGAHPLHVLLDTSAGRILLFVGVLLDGLGVMWTARLISSAERPRAVLAATPGAPLAVRPGATLAEWPGATLGARGAASQAQPPEAHTATAFGRSSRRVPKTEARR
jgi:tight adherence protein B